MVPTLSVALAVEDVERASRFYQQLGFRETFTIPGPGGGLAVAILSTGTSQLLLGPLDEPHYESEARAALIRTGPRGLGMTLMLLVEDLAAIYDLVREQGLPILLEPVDEYYGDRVFFFLDPFGFEWKIAQQIETLSEDEVYRRATGTERAGG
jgi:uncharacterized glyoxalase superfamily protein PhnB